MVEMGNRTHPSRKEEGLGQVQEELPVEIYGWSGTVADFKTPLRIKKSNSDYYKPCIFW